MAKPLWLRSIARAPRVKLAGTVLALVRLENKRQFTGKLHQLSVTGGLLHLPNPLDEGIKVEIIFHIGGGTVRNRAVILFPMWATQGYLQPFEFVDLTPGNQQIVSEHLAKLLCTVRSVLAQGTADQQPHEPLT